MDGHEMHTIFQHLRDLRKWSKLTRQFIEHSSIVLLECAGAEFSWNGVVTSNGLSIATFKHLKTEMVFSLIPGGTSQLGLSDAEFEFVRHLPMADEELLNSLRPSEKVDVAPFLFSQLPLLEETVERYLALDQVLFRPDFQPLSGERTGKVPIYLTRAEVNAVIGHFDFSLPSEAQWEYAVRAGTQSPFYFGTEIPNSREMSQIMKTDFRDSHGLTMNRFGIAGMLTGGWCLDTFQQRRWHGKDSQHPHVIRGGAAIYWPWQNTGEWMLALSAMRRSSDELEDETCSAHVVALLHLHS